MNSDSSTTVFLLLLLFSLLSSIHLVKPQPSPSPDDQFQYAKFSPSMAIIIIILITALFFMGFFSIYIRRWSNDENTTAGGGLSILRAGRYAAASSGLDAGILETFPTFTYSTVKGLKIGKGALECAVCLNEFADDETIRLIPKCDHVFHVECIDAWLVSHVTCPVCRSNLVHISTESTQPQRDTDSELGLGFENNSNNNNTNNNQTATVTGGGEEGRADVRIPVDRNPVLGRVKSATPYRPARSKSVNRNPLFDKFRSHSTGHSLAVPIGEDTERFTLRLPEEVRTEVINNALLNRSGSTVKLAGEESGKKGYRTGEGSSSSKGRSYRRMGSLDRSVFSRAPSFLSRAFSTRSQKVNGGASTTSDTIPLNNIGLKSDDVVGSGRPPV